MIDDALSGRDPTTVCHLYAVPDDADVFDEANWSLANPALGDFRSLDDMRAQAARARRMPSFEARSAIWYCNQRISADAPLVSRSEWVACRCDGPLIEDGERVSSRARPVEHDGPISPVGRFGQRRGSRIAQFWKPRDLDG